MKTDTEQHESESPEIKERPPYLLILSRALIWFFLRPEVRKFVKVRDTYSLGGFRLCWRLAVEKFGRRQSLQGFFQSFLVLVRAIRWLLFPPEKRKFAKVWVAYKSGGIASFWARALEKFGEYAFSLNAAPENSWRAISFPPSDDITVSIVIPMHNNCLYSFTCLKSILQNTSGIRYEVIAVDDGSEDDTARMLAQCQNIKVFTNYDAKGFLVACNLGIQRAQGRYVMLLNNDTKVTNGWLDALLEPFSQDPTVGLVGAKLIYPDGRLQEAGGVIWKDGSGWNYGHGDEADKPEYSYVREVDYCSGAAVLVRKEILERLGGLDLRYVPAYYEDTDLAFSVRDMGFKVVFQPACRIVHYEGVSCGRSISVGIKKFQLTNRAKFQEKWRDALSGHLDPGEKICLARERGKEKRILIIDHYVPEPDKDSGSVRMSWIARIFNELGHKVIFWPDDLRRREPYTSQLQEKGVEVIYGKNSLDKYLDKNGKYLDIVWISRRDIAGKYYKTVRRLTKAPICFDTVDLHYLREMRGAEILGKGVFRASVERAKERELYLARNSDVTVVVSPVEKHLLQKEGIFNVEILSNIHIVPASACSLEGRKDLMFIGGFVHHPNVDGITWFVNSIFPGIKKILPDIRLYVVGSNPPSCIRALANSDVIVTGYQKDADTYFRKSRIFVCPLRYGSGVKGKIGHSMSMGLPVVATPVGAEGMGLVHEESALIADNEGSFVTDVVRLYGSDELWKRLSLAGVSHVRKLYSPEAAKKKIQAMMEKVLLLND